MSTDEETLKRRYREFLDLLPLTVAIAGLPASETHRSYTPEQMEARRGPWAPPSNWRGKRCARRSARAEWPPAQRRPPEMYSVSPVIQLASSEAKNTTAGAMSCGWPIRPSGVCASVCLRKSLSVIPAE